VVSKEWRDIYQKHLASIINRQLLWKNGSKVTFGYEGRSCVQISDFKIPPHLPFAVAFTFTVNSSCDWLAVGVCGASEEGHDGFNRGNARDIWGWSSNGCLWQNGTSPDNQHWSPFPTTSNTAFEIKVIVFKGILYLQQHHNSFPFVVSGFRTLPVYPMCRINSSQDSITLGELSLYDNIELLKREFKSKHF